MIKIKGHYGPEYRIKDPGNGVIGSALKEGIPYEHKVLYHIYRQGFSGTAIDVGAHIGNHSLWFALACDLSVKAFEPVAYEELWDNVKLNCLEDLIDVFPFALGAEVTGARAVGKGELVQEDGGEIAVHCLDEYDFEDVSVMKIDVEGWEPAVLMGASATLERCSPRLYVEGRDAAAREENKKVLTELGYKYTGLTFGATPLEEWSK